MEQATNKGHLVLARKYRPKTLGRRCGSDCPDRYKWHRSESALA